MMLPDEDIEIDDNFFDEFSSDLLSEHGEGCDILMQEETSVLSVPAQKRDFSSFLTPWDPSQSIMRGAGAVFQAMDFGRCTSSGNSTESASECSSSCSGDLNKKKTRLEKNRESATKCRLKKKNELNTLTGKITELMKTISRLTQENAALRADNASLSDHNRFLRSLVSSQPELPLHASINTDSQQAAGAASGIAILGIFGAFTLFSRGGGYLTAAGHGGNSVGRVLENPLQDLMQEQAAGSQFHVFIVGVFLCLVLYAAASYGVQLPAAAPMRKQKKQHSLLPSHSNANISTKKENRHL